MKNGKNTPLNKSSFGLPDVSGAMRGWFLPFTFKKITKEVVDFKEVETSKTIHTKGVLQPMKPQELRMKPEGQRDWRWHTLHTELGVDIRVEDIIIYDCVKYRVLNKGNFSKYGYLRFDLVEDYKV